MTSLILEARSIQDFFEERGWRFCFIGGLAVLRWGEPRMTVDADLTLFTGFGGEEPFIDALAERFRPRVSEMRRFAIKNLVVLLWSDLGIPFDVALAGLPFEETAVTNATPFEFAKDVFLKTCTAEDLIVMKAFSGREKDWSDIEGVLAKQRGRLNWPRIWESLEPLAAATDKREMILRLKRLAE